jgi:hypothetical protein
MPFLCFTLSLPPISLSLLNFLQPALISMSPLAVHGDVGLVLLPRSVHYEGYRSPPSSRAASASSHSSAVSSLPTIPLPFSCRPGYPCLNHRSLLPIHWPEIIPLFSELDCGSNLTNGKFRVPYLRSRALPTRETLSSRGSATMGLRSGQAPSTGGRRESSPLSRSWPVW